MWTSVDAASENLSKPHLGGWRETERIVLAGFDLVEGKTSISNLFLKVGFLLSQITKRFIKEYKEKTGVDVGFRLSFGASGTQVRGGQRPSTLPRLVSAPTASSALGRESHLAVCVSILQCAMVRPVSQHLRHRSVHRQSSEGFRLAVLIRM